MNRILRKEILKAVKKAFIVAIDNEDFVLGEHPAIIMNLNGGIEYVDGNRICDGAALIDIDRYIFKDFLNSFVENLDHIEGLVNEYLLRH